MDTSALRLAYAALLEGARRVARAADLLAPAPGEWDAEQLLAHVVSVDAGVLAAAAGVVAGEPVRFDNRTSLDEGNLARIARRVGGQEGLRHRIGVQGEVLAVLAGQLGEEELGQPVPTLLQSGGTVVLDGVLTLGELVGGLAEDHLPRHTHQLLALLAP